MLPNYSKYYILHIERQVNSLTQIIFSRELFTHSMRRLAGPLYMDTQCIYIYNLYISFLVKALTTKPTF